MTEREIPVGSVIPVYGPRQVTLISRATELTRLHYFNGRLLRAPDLEREQGYVRQLTRLTNQAGGSGVVHGLSLSVRASGAADGRAERGDSLHLGRGLAIDSAGQLLYLPYDVELDLSRLLQEESRTEPGRNGDFQARLDRPIVSASDRSPIRLYRLQLSLAEGPLGYEEVFGASYAETSYHQHQGGESAWLQEGVILQAVPLLLPSELANTSPSALRSQLAARLFRQEDQLLRGDLRLSAAIGPLWQDIAGPAGQRFSVGAEAPETKPAEAGVPLGILAVLGQAVLFMDPWMLRRERIENPAERGFAGLLGMRPLASFLAQIYQFQYQLFERARDAAVPQSDRRILEHALEVLQILKGQGGAAGVPNELLEAARQIAPSEVGRVGELLDLYKARDNPGADAPLVEQGFLDLPPAGFLPVRPERVIGLQVEALLGREVEVRMHEVRQDSVPRLLLRAQHRDRIPLLAENRGPDRGKHPRIDVLVPLGSERTLNRAPRWVLFTQAIDDELITYAEPEAEQSPRGMVRHDIYRVPFTAAIEPAAFSPDLPPDLEHINRLSRRIGSALFDGQSGKLLEDVRYRELLRGWGQTRRYRVLYVQNPQSTPGKRQSEIVALNERLSPPQKLIDLSTELYRGLPDPTLPLDQCRTYLFTAFQARLVLLDAMQRRIPLPEQLAVIPFDEAGEPEPRSSDVNREGAAILSNVAQFVGGTPVAEQIRFVMHTELPPGVELERIRAWLQERGLLARGAPEDSQLYSPERLELPLFQEGGVVVDMLVVVQFRG